MKNNSRVRLTSYISQDLDDLILDYMQENNISTKSQAIERMLIEFKYMKNEIIFLRSLAGGMQIQPQNNVKYTQNKPIEEKDKVMDSISEIYTNMPD